MAKKKATKKIKKKGVLERFRETSEEIAAEARADAAKTRKLVDASLKEHIAKLELERKAYMAKQKISKRKAPRITPKTPKLRR